MMCLNCGGSLLIPWQVSEKTQSSIWDSCGSIDMNQVDLLMSSLHELCLMCLDSLSKLFHFGHGFQHCCLAVEFFPVKSKIRNVRIRNAFL